MLGGADVSGSPRTSVAVISINSSIFSCLRWSIESGEPYARRNIPWARRFSAHLASRSRSSLSSQGSPNSSSVGRGILVSLVVAATLARGKADSAFSPPS